jgi:NADH dehydrogenase/NADH:ubiquinone oxidoreductase subunit G
MGLADGDTREVDHIQSGNTLDNRRSNLRIVTKQQNMMNKRTYKNNTVGVRGITMEKGRYRAQLQVEGKRVYLPRVDTLEEAVRLRKEAVEKYHGEYACS